MKISNLRILYLSSAPPRECGIATFTQGLMKAIKKEDPFIDQKIIAVNERGAPKRNYPATVKYMLEQEDLDSYNKTAMYINESGANIFCLQHEFGLYGGFDGIFILKLLKKIKIPIVTSLHTLPILKGSKRKEYRLKLLKDIGKLSKYVVVTANIGKRVLIKKCALPREKVVTVYHGAPDIPFPMKKEREELKKKYKLKEKFIISTYGLLSESKGIDFGIEAITKLRKKYPKIVYLILGESHPIKMKIGEDYSQKLRKKIGKLKLKNNVLFINRYLKEGELIDYLKLTDIYLIPYLTREQISSGTLAWAMATGNCVVATPFTYARELIGKDRGYFVDFKNSNSIKKVISNLIKNPQKIEKAKKKAYEFSRKFTWPKVGKKYIEVFKRAIKK